ncbi:MAG: type II toxin-antitoxin system Phd/YefM family antitoxin [Bacteroidota bacterium]
MQYISATEAKQKLAAMLDAVQVEPVMIRRQNRDTAVVISPKEYERLRKLNIQEFQDFCDRVSQNARQKGLSEEKLNELLRDDDE